MSRFIFIFVIAPMFFSGCVRASLHGCRVLYESEKTIRSIQLQDHDELETEWLQHMVTVNEAEVCLPEESGYRNIEAMKADSITNQFLVRPWEELLSLKEAKDNLWIYDTPDIHWSSLAGQRGAVLLRECMVMGKIITMQS